MTHQLRYRSWIIYCALILTISLPIVRIQAFPHSGSAEKSEDIEAPPAQNDRQTIQIEPGKPIERELTGGQSHSYQMTLAAGQYVRLAVDQRGIDVVAQLFGLDGKQIAESDKEIRLRGVETVSWVAEVAGSYRLDLLARYKNSAAGQYEIRVDELRVATDDDRTLHEALELNTEFFILGRAGKYDEAQPLGERILKIREGILGLEHPDVAETLHNLANIHASIGDHAKAELLYQRALTIREKVFGPQHPAVALTLNNLASLYANIKDKNDKVASYFERALAILEKALEPQHFAIAQTLSNLAEFYSLRGDYAKAEPLFQRALPALEKALGPQHPVVAQTLSNLGNLYSEKGDRGDRGEYAKAEPLYERALAIYEKTLGTQHPRVAQLFNNVAMLYRERGDYAKAEPLFQRALTIWEKTLGPNHLFVARSLGNLAVLYRKSGDYTKAEPLHERALTIVKNALGADHPYISEILTDFSMLYAAKGDIGQATVTLSRANDVNEGNFAVFLNSGSERQKLAYLDTYYKWANFTLSFHSEFAPNDTQALNLAFTALLRRKARGLDVMADTIATLRRNAEQQDRELFDKLKEALSQLAAASLEDPETVSPERYRSNLDSLKKKVEKLEAELSSRNDQFKDRYNQSKPVTLSAVQAALPANSALIEFAYFTPLDPKTEKTEPPRYLAYLLAPQGQPNWVDLGEAAPIDQAINAWRKALRNPNRTDVKRFARALDELLMQPVRALLSDMPGNASNLLISPDSSLNLIPFAALVDKQHKYLIEQYSITYLTSGRDLLRLQTSEPSKSAPLVVANPDFDSFSTIAMKGSRASGKSLAGKKAARSSGRGGLITDKSHIGLPSLNGVRVPLVDGLEEARDLVLVPTQLYFNPLPATKDEALAIKALFPKASLLQQEDATETALKQAAGPQILHVATHGFFLDYQGPSPAEADQPSVSSSGTTLLASSRANPYTIQFAAAPELETAQDKVKELKARGVDAYIVKSEVKGKGTFFRVRAGNFRTLVEAQKYGAGLKDKGVVSEYFVARYAPPQVDATEQKATLRVSRFATKIKDSLLRSGLALAGANHGKSGEDDGVLTALEAAYLNLSGTKLVVLSACNTGVGEVKNGEGVQGLRRALVLAGSESQVMSLWPISDEATKDLMIRYYMALRGGEGRSEGLRQVQLRMLHGPKGRRHPYYWAAFIQSGEWANLDGQR
jgi:CHAT domain-containing protein/Tfp pilus assembly protein PilF